MTPGARTVAIVGSGDMGSAIAGSLVAAGMTVLTSLDGRSAQSRDLAAMAGMQDVGSLAALVDRADLFLSIVPPAAAAGLAATVLGLIARSGRDVLFVDCNAVSPSTCAGIAADAAGLDVPFQDAGIIGQPPGPGRPAARFYTSGPHSDALCALATEQVDVRPLGEDPGRASAIKMAYASLTKGTNALRVAALLVGERLGVGAALRAEIAASLPRTHAEITARLPDLAADSARWTGEMREISATYESAGLPPTFHEAAEAIYALLAGTPLAAESRDEARTSGRSVEETLAIFVAALDRC